MKLVDLILGDAPGTTQTLGKMELSQSNHSASNCQKGILCRIAYLLDWVKLL